VSRGGRDLVYRRAGVCVCVCVCAGGLMCRSIHVMLRLWFHKDGRYCWRYQLGCRRLEGEAGWYCGVVIAGSGRRRWDSHRCALVAVKPKRRQGMMSTQPLRHIGVNLISSYRCQQLQRRNTSRLPPQAYDTPTDTPSNNGHLYEIIDVTWHV